MRSPQHPNRSPVNKPAWLRSVQIIFRKWGAALPLLVVFLLFAIRPGFLSAQAGSQQSQSGSEIQATAANALPQSRSNFLENANASENGLPAGLDVNEMLSPNGLSSTLKVMLLGTQSSAVDPDYDHMFYPFCDRLGVAATGAGNATTPSESGDCITLSVSDVSGDGPCLEAVL